MLNANGSSVSKGGLNPADLEELRPTMVDVARIAKALFRSSAADVVVLNGDVAWRASLTEAGAAAPLVQRVVARRDVEWIEDLRADEATANLEAVTGEVALRFFAGAPLTLEDGECVGALVVYDLAPRAHDRKLSARLADLARIVARDFGRIRAVRERAEGQERLARQEERFRIAIETAGLHVYEIDFAGRQLYKAGAEDTFYVTPKTYADLYKDPWNSLHAADRDIAVGRWDAAQARGEPWRSEHRIERGDGTQVWVFATAKLIEDAAGKPLRLIGALQNISDRKRAEVQAKANAAQLRFALESAEGAAWSMNEKTGVISGLDELSRMAGFAICRDDLVQVSRHIAHPDDREEVVAFLKHVRAGERSEVEHRFFDPEGNVKWAHSSGQAFVSDTGETELVFLTLNTTRRRALEQEFADALGHAAQSLENKRSLLMSIAGELGQVDAAVPETAPEITRDRENAQSDLHARLASLLAEIDLRDGAIARAIDALRESRSAAEAANTAKSQFVANMSHELRTPLNAVIGYAEILQEDLEDAGMETASKDATRIRNAARNLLGLINEILDLAKIEAGKLDVSVADVEVPVLVQDAVQTVARAAEEKGNKLTLTIDPDVRMARTDDIRLRQCLLNLLSNACKFTTNGRVDMHVKRIVDRDGDLLSFEVRDTGIGLTPEQIGRLFQAFAQADSTTTRKFGGTGLGLAITRKLAQLLGGDVAVTSVHGEGSTFTLTVRAELDRSSAEIADADIGGPLVLVIDDEPDARDLLKRSLIRLGYSSRSTFSGVEGVALAGELRPALIVLDIKLPDISGWDALMTLKSDPLTAHIPVIILSADDDVIRAVALGACEHLVKPVDRIELESAIRTAVGDWNDEMALAI